MEFADHHGVEPAKTDRVSSFIRALAVGLMVWAWCSECSIGTMCLTA